MRDDDSSINLRANKATKKDSRHVVSPFYIMERMKGIEPSYQAWEARILPLELHPHILSYYISLTVKSLFVKR